MIEEIVEVVKSVALPICTAMFVGLSILSALNPTHNSEDARKLLILACYALFTLCVIGGWR